MANREFPEELRRKLIGRKYTGRCFLCGQEIVVARTEVFPFEGIVLQGCRHFCKGYRVDHGQARSAFRLEEASA